MSLNENAYSDRTKDLPSHLKQVLNIVSSPAPGSGTSSSNRPLELWSSLSLSRVFLLGVEDPVEIIMNHNFLIFQLFIKKLRKKNNYKMERVVSSL